MKHFLTIKRMYMQDKYIFASCKSLPFSVRKLTFYTLKDGKMYLEEVVEVLTCIIHRLSLREFQMSVRQ